MTPSTWLGNIVLYAKRQRTRQRFGLRAKRWRNIEPPLAYLESGAGLAGPTLVFLHGLGASKDHWGDSIYRLAGTHHCLFVDLPGEGESGHNARDSYSPQAQVARIHDFLTAKQVNNPVLVGASIGGCIAALYAATYPLHVHKLIAIAPAGLSCPSMSPVMDTFLRTGRHPFGYRSTDEMYAFWRLVFYNPPSVPAFIARALTVKGARRYSRINKSVADFLREGIFPLTDVLKHIRAEALFLWGREDRVFDVSCTDTLARSLPRAWIQILDRAGHVPYLDCGGETVHEIERFLTGDAFARAPVRIEPSCAARGTHCAPER